MQPVQQQGTAEGRRVLARPLVWALLQTEGSEEMKSRRERSPALTLARLRELLHYDPDTGIFTRVKRCGRMKAGAIAGTKHKDGRVIICIDCVLYKAHRLAWLYVYGKWPDGEIDHKDTNGFHNWIDNLRLATHSQNGQNKRRALSNSKSGILGVRWHLHTKKWSACISVNGKQRHIGLFATAEEACAAHLAEKKRAHPFFELPENTTEESA